MVGNDYAGYDPVIQAQGVHGNASDRRAARHFMGWPPALIYLCGYLGTWAGVTAMYAREHREDGQGDWAETSLSNAAALTQLLLLQTPEPESARGGSATGMTGRRNGSMN